MMNTSDNKYKFIYKIPYKYSSEQMEGFNISAFIVNSEAYPYINYENTITYIQRAFPKDVISDKYFYEAVDSESGYFYCNSLKGIYLYKSTFQMKEDGFSMNDNAELFLDLNHLIGHINYLNIIITNLLNQLNKSQSDNTTLLNKINLLNTDILTLSNKINLLNNDKSTLVNKINQLNSDIVTLTNKINLLNNDITVVTAERDLAIIDKNLALADLSALLAVVMRNTASAKDHLFMDICRISADGKYLEIDMSCDPNYTYKSFGFYDYLDDMNANKPTDLISYLDTDVNGEYKSRLLLRINLDKLNGKSMYYIIVEIWLKEYNIDGTYNDYQSVTKSIEVFTNAVSDVTNAYFYLLPGLIQLTKPCDPCDIMISPEIQRAFLVLWSHLEAMRLKRWKEAEMFYTLIKNNFQICLGDFEVKPKFCNCHELKWPNFNYRR